MKIKSDSTLMNYSKPELIEEIRRLEHNLECSEFHSDTCFKMVMEFRKILSDRMFDEMLDKCSNGNLTRLGLMDKYKESEVAE